MVTRFKGDRCLLLEIDIDGRIAVWANLHREIGRARLIVDHVIRIPVRGQSVTIAEAIHQLTADDERLLIRHAKFREFRIGLGRVIPILISKEHVDVVVRLISLVDRGPQRLEREVVHTVLSVLGVAFGVIGNAEDIAGVVGRFAELPAGKYIVILGGQRILAVGHGKVVAHAEIVGGDYAFLAIAVIELDAIGLRLGSSRNGDADILRRKVPRVSRKREVVAIAVIISIPATINATISG